MAEQPQGKLPAQKTACDTSCSLPSVHVMSLGLTQSRRLSAHTGPIPPPLSVTPGLGRLQHSHITNHCCYSTLPRACPMHSPHLKQAQQLSIFSLRRRQQRGKENLMGTRHVLPSSSQTYGFRDSPHPKPTHTCKLEEITSGNEASKAPVMAVRQE